MPNLKHGISTWLKTGKVNPSIRGHRKLQKYLQEMERDLIEDLGGQSNLTAAQEMIVKATIEAYGVLILAAIYVKKTSILRPDKAKQGIVELQPVLGHQFLAFMNTIRQNLMALGIERKKTSEVLDLGRYIESKYGDEKEASDEAKNRSEKLVERRTPQR